MPPHPLPHTNVHVLLVSRAYAALKEKWALEEKRTSQMLRTTWQEEEQATQIVSVATRAHQGQL